METLCKQMAIEVMVSWNALNVPPKNLNKEHHSQTKEQWWK
jgi:hypothetical protein